MDIDMNSSQAQKPKVPFYILILACVGVCSLFFIAWKIYSVSVSKTIKTVEINTKPADNTSSEVPQPPINNTGASEVPAVPTETVTGTDAIGNFVLSPNNTVREYTLPNNEKLSVKWYKGAIPLSDAEVDKIFTQIDPNYKDEMKKISCDPENTFVCELHLFKTGEIAAPTSLKGKTVYILMSMEEGMMQGLTADHVIITDNPKKLLVFEEHDYTNYVSPTINKWVLGTLKVSLPELTPPPKLTIPGQKSYLIFKTPLSTGNSVWTTDGTGQNIGGILSSKTNEVVKPYPSKEIVFTDPKYGPVYFHDGSYNIFMPDGSVMRYELLPYFFAIDEMEAEKNMYSGTYLATGIKWNANIKTDPNEKFIISGDFAAIGCSGKAIAPVTNVILDKDWFDESKLVKIGETTIGREPIFELSNAATNTFYKELFDYGYAGSKLFELNGDYESMNIQMNQMTDEQKLADFAADHPLFFWKDYRGNWRGYQKSKYMPTAECGKPVIYLYPEKNTSVSVKVAPNGGITVSEPLYGENGWLVGAKPSGELYNYANKTKYPYLFWEGKADGFGFPEQGFVFAKKDVADGMKKVLESAGLNEKETADFLEFWLPKMTVKPYVFVTFANQRDFEKAAPLTISPKPNTVIRVFMSFENLDNPKVVKPLKLHAPKRNGFTVVEWGGVLQK